MRVVHISCIWLWNRTYTWSKKHGGIGLKQRFGFSARRPLAWKSRIAETATGSPVRKLVLSGNKGEVGKSHVWSYGSCWALIPQFQLKTWKIVWTGLKTSRTCVPTVGKFGWETVYRFLWGAHRGVWKVCTPAAKSVYWKRMYEDINPWIRGCL